MDKTKGWVESGQKGEDGWGRGEVVRVKCRQLHLNNNKIIFKKDTRKSEKKNKVLSNKLIQGNKTFVR